MVKNHLKRIATNKNWKLAKKKQVYITKPNPGSHPLSEGFAIVIAMRDILKIARTRKETRDIMLNKEVLVDGVKRKNHKFMIGLMDVISFPQLNKNYRVSIDQKGRLALIEIDEKEAKLKITKIIGKTCINKKIQLNLNDGKNVLIDKNGYQVNESVVLELPSQKIIEHLKFEKKATILLTGGRHMGTIGTVENIDGNKLVFKNEKNEIFETLKSHAYIIGKEKSALKIR